MNTSSQLILGRLFVMEENRKDRLEQIAQLEENIKKLPAKLQEAIYWAIKNFDVLKEICKEPGMTLEEIQSEMEKTWAKEQYDTHILLYIAKYMMEENEE